MAKTVCLDEEHSTTRLCHKLLDGSLLDEHGGVKEELKFKIDIPEFKIKNSRILGKPEDKFETMLFLPEGDGRQGEGGLRTKGYFKHSYRMVDDEWCIVDSDANPIMPAPAEIKEAIDHRLSTINHQPSTISLPLITVITVVLNGEKYLEETIQSVINQTYPNVEYIIIDGGSTDGTLDIIKKYEDYIDYWVSEKDKGISDAWNKGIFVATGEVIGIINADDWYELDAIATAISGIVKNRAEIVHGMLRYWDGAKKTEVFSGNDNLLYKHMTVNHATVFVSRACYKSFGVFRSDFRCSMDYEWLLRAKTNGAVFLYTEKCIANMRFGGISDRKYLLGLREVEKARSLHLSAIINPYISFMYHFTKRSIRFLLEKIGLYCITRFYHAHFSIVKKQVEDSNSTAEPKKGRQATF